MNNNCQNLALWHKTAAPQSGRVDVTEEIQVQEKIIDLQTRFSFQEDVLSQLNDEVVRQQRQITELVRELAAIKQQMAELSDRESKTASANEAHEVPPHY